MPAQGLSGLSLSCTRVNIAFVFIRSSRDCQCVTVHVLEDLINENLDCPYMNTQTVPIHHCRIVIAFTLGCLRMGSTTSSIGQTGLGNFLAAKDQARLTSLTSKYARLHSIEHSIHSLLVHALQLSMLHAVPARGKLVSCMHAAQYTWRRQL